GNRHARGWRTDGARDDDLVADFPAADALGQRERSFALLGGGAELNPGTTHGCAMEIHAAAAADDGGAGFLVHAFHVHQPDQCPVLGVDGPLRRTDFQGSTRSFLISLSLVRVTIEPFFTVLIAALNLDQADVELGVLVVSKAQRASDVDR